MDRLGPGSIYRFLAPVVEVGVSGETRVGRQTCSGLIIALALEGKCPSLLAADPRALRHSDPRHSRGGYWPFASHQIGWGALITLSLIESGGFYGLSATGL